MGIVPENEYTIGCECAGYIKRIAPGLQTHLKVGDRVAAMRSGTYVNRVQCPHERVHIIPDSMSFEEAATIPLVYLTAIYSLYHLGNLKEGQSVLIHSAAGGVGLAAIQLAQYKKCDIFVTVGTNDKREFLAKNFGIPKNRMFNSRNTKFADEIRRETNGRGVDVILNSLIGELLDESWRLTADGGIMVEIGKRDIVDRNTLAMEPFDRNCSFRAVDLSYTKEITNELIGKLMVEIFDLVKGGHIGPIRPITKYGFDQVIPALSYIRRGQHIGKIVVSSGEKEDVQLPIRPAVPKLQLDPEAAYLIVGGLRGLCGSLAVHMARHGARHIIAMSRSGIQDEASARIVTNCAAYGCRITEAKGDAGDLDFVSRVFRSTQPQRIAGLIQGAMVLRASSSLQLLF
jgi:NADPH:quinone reductase-like Zn-dependent oxidoreductase